MNLSGKTVPLTEADVESRRLVWGALSDLFLDTDVSLTRKWRIGKLAASPFSVDELEAILIDEVYPVCIGNLRCMAGEWVEFDRLWLEQQILSRRKPPRRFRRFSWRWLSVPFWPEWRATKAGVAAARQLHRACDE